MKKRNGILEYIEIFESDLKNSLINSAIEDHSISCIYDYITNLFPCNISDQKYLQNDLGFGTKKYTELEPFIIEEFEQKIMISFRSFIDDIYYFEDDKNNITFGNMEDLEEFEDEQDIKKFTDI
jgi:hypothetical protein